MHVYHSLVCIFLPRSGTLASWLGTAACALPVCGYSPEFWEAGGLSGERGWWWGPLVQLSGFGPWKSGASRAVESMGLEVSTAHPCGIPEMAGGGHLPAACRWRESLKILQTKKKDAECACWCWMFFSGYCMCLKLWLQQKLRLNSVSDMAWFISFAVYLLVYHLLSPQSSNG